MAGLTGLSAFGELSGLAGRAVEASEASRTARDRFRRAEALVARVTAMTDLLDIGRIGSEFTANADALEAGLGRLKASALSERMLTLSNTAEAEARQWRAGAEILLGLRKAREIPTLAVMARYSAAIGRDLDEAVALAGQEAQAQIGATGAAMSWKIGLMLALSAATVGAGAGVAFWLAGSLSKPLVVLARDTTRLAGATSTSSCRPPTAATRSGRWSPPSGCSRRISSIAGLSKPRPPRPARPPSAGRWCAASPTVSRRRSSGSSARSEPPPLSSARPRRR
ncbi:hypothetical protein GCM10025880_37580 [Methylorubrum aminovorans]|uniref:hypothetical protein n=1 Tax=Methylorubrum aminovorans TaxID=269069 RepID=UPI0023E9A001|nr:hypothetical protein GCM10025880_37580 [Methylorubrum aminovorans]